ncbi:MAG: zinc-dependent metalloprotease, partial [Bacteroidaceae bacterium]|nr:zinc-dependent metalloprotease [Bacteroidaceae bacterium]
WLLIAIISMSGATAYAAPKKKEKKKGKTEQVETPPETAYSKLIKECQKQEGLFTTYLNDKNELYFEIPDSLLGRDYLISNRLAATSDPTKIVAGQMIGRPTMIRFSRNEQMVFLHRAQVRNVVAEGDEITPSFNKNFIDPIVASFKIEAKSDNKKAVVVNVTKFFNENNDIINPQGEIAKKDRHKGGKGHFESIKNFPNNIEIRSVISFTDNTALTLTMHRSLVLLPEEPMMPRLRDKRVGYFSTTKNIFSSSIDKVDNETFIHRWRLEPREEDREAYLRGELVVPAKPIVFYVDTAFPVKWRATVRQGIEDWKTAFEKAGFKDAIIARDYPSPEEDPNFNPDDMRYSCVKYATTAIANARGPSYVDPRSGEILTADVLWFHNILSLVHNWRFTQTAAVDERVRKNIFDDDVMCESLRYVASHEIGHTIGLMHNMGASYSFPIDSLRSPSFTQKYGTTPSIMDYARNNFVAQPGDYERGVRLTPPILGVHDIFAVEWGYRYYPDINSPEDERKYLTALINAKSNDPMFEFGAQQFPTTIDPTDQTEDLGNDHLRAGDYAISNLRIITANMLNWLKEEGEDYDDMVTTYSAIVSQY